MLCCLWVAATWSRSSTAELDPYYVMRGAGTVTAKPRILFVLDTSGSMTWRSDSSNGACAYASCEYGSGTDLSRIAASRRAIRSVIEQSQELAEFSLMTFGQAQPPSSGGQVPSTSECSGARFNWVTWHHDSYNGWQYTNLYGYQGMWLLCGENKPYPYIRWDYLGKNSVIASDDQTGPVPASPLISAEYSSFSHPDHAYRPVQWFPRFMGVRINLNSDSDPLQDTLNDTYGDYGNNSSDRLNYVWGRDFYYWPYVDGFPGYSMWWGWNPVDGYTRQMGTADQPSYSGASLYAPFFLPEVHDELNPNAWGPHTKQESTEMVRGFTGPMHEGGVDANGGTPWGSTIGPIVSSPLRSNSPFSHSTVASYLQFVKNATPDTLCVPLTAVLITDGDPSPSTEGGSKLHGRLAALRNEIGSKVYVVGFVHSSLSLNNMACAAAGSNNDTTPCYGTPAKAWDTCYDPSNPTGACAFLATDPESLADTITNIVTGVLELSLESGPGFSVNEFGVGQSKQYGTEEGTIQTSLTASTEWPSWRGHVERAGCLDTDPLTGELADHCVVVGFDEEFHTFGPCGPSREWDAGECLQQTDYNDRRIYSHTADHTVYPIADASGRPTAKFIQELNASDLNLPGRPYDEDSATELVEFILGKNAPVGWKIPGLSQSSPIVVRRVAKKNLKYSPTVGIRDPHCAGRRLSQNVTIPESLEKFSDEVWDGILATPEPHLEYQEAALIGDDLGMLHAFQLDSGNELWGFIPRHMLERSIRGMVNGPELMGQNKNPDEHVFGLGGTVNHGWTFDPNRGTEGGWRHLAVMGSAAGGDHFMVLDVSHMSPLSPRGPVEVMWTSKDKHLRNAYELTTGQTWARAALTYHVPNDEISKEPITILVLSSGYPEGVTPPAGQGKSILKVDALTGKILDSAVLPAPETPLYEPNYANIVDPAVATHCSSRFWAEAQEVYFPDPAGRLFRWDLGWETEHSADSGGLWEGKAIPAATFTACQGTDEYNCNIAPTNKGDPFHYGPAVVSSNRIDEMSGAPSGVLDESYRNNFVVALNSGTSFEKALDPTDNDFHASLYIMVDDHRSDSHGGFTIPAGAPKKADNEDPKFWRQAVTDFERTRRYRPLDDGDWYEERRKFSRRTFPIRSPRIYVERGYETDAEGNFKDWLDATEFLYIEFTVFEAPSGTCSGEWYDEANDEWKYDEGSTYILRGRMVSEDGQDFSFLQDGDETAPDRHGFTKRGLQFMEPEQVLTGDCEDGSCTPNPGSKSAVPCDPNVRPPEDVRPTSVRLGFQQLSGFSPVEIPISTSTEVTSP